MAVRPSSEPSLPFATIALHRSRNWTKVSLPPDCDKSLIRSWRAISVESGTFFSGGESGGRAFRKRNGHMTTTTPPSFGFGKSQVRTRLATQISNSELAAVLRVIVDAATEPVPEITNLIATI